MTTLTEYEQVADYAEYKVLDKGWVKLDNFMGSDSDTAACARESYKKGTKQINNDIGLLDHLIRNMHTSPLEMPIVRYRQKIPLFVLAQQVRHRTHAMNQLSLRYSESELEFYEPEEWRLQDALNKQGSHGFLEDPDDLAFMIQHQHEIDEHTGEVYRHMLEKGISREMARIILPQALYTELVWQQNLHNHLHLLKLRMDGHAQWEIQQYALTMHGIVKQLFPIITHCWDNHVFNGVRVSADEKSVIRELIALHQDLLGDLPDRLRESGLSKTRLHEFENKFGIKF